MVRKPFCWSPKKRMGAALWLPSLLLVGSLMTSNYQIKWPFVILFLPKLCSNWHYSSFLKVPSQSLQHNTFTVSYFFYLGFIFSLTLGCSCCIPPVSLKRESPAKFLLWTLFLFYALSQGDINHSMISTISCRPTFTKFYSSPASFPEYQAQISIFHTRLFHWNVP